MRSKKEVEFITKEDLINILDYYGQTQEFQQMVDDIYKPEITLIENLKGLCNIYLSTINSPMPGAQEFGQALGANIIFNLRKLFVGRDITLLLGATAPGSHKQLRLAEYSLTKLLKNPNNYNAKQGIHLLKEFEQYHNMKKNNSFSSTIEGKFSGEKHRAQVWEKLLDSQQLTEVDKEDFDAGQPVDIYKSSSGKEYRVYQRHKMDTSVYYAYMHKKEAHKPLSKEGIMSLYKTRDKYQFFNRGWLFEWFTRKWSNLDPQGRTFLYQQIMQSPHPLAYIIDKGDNIPGVKGGDFRNAFKTKDYQTKYGNTKIISRYSINETLYKIIAILDKEKSNMAEISSQFAQLFTSKRNLDIDESSVQELNIAVDRITRPMEKKMRQNFKAQIKI